MQGLAPLLVSLKEAYTAVNRFMQHRFPNGTWTSSKTWSKNLENLCTTSLLYLVFRNRVLFQRRLWLFFVDRLSPSLPLRPELALTRGLKGSELAFRRLKSAHKVRVKSFGP